MYHVFTEDYAPVLIVDDTVFNIMILQNIFLINHKIKTDQAISGEEAIMKCKQRITLGQEAYRLIVMDINNLYIAVFCVTLISYLLKGNL